MEKHLVLILLLVTLCQGQDHPKCFISGRCVESQLLTVLATKNEIDCLEACRANLQCKWFSYFSDTNFCEILANCETIDLPGERTWVSGQINCTMPECGINGICQGHSYNAASVSNQEECLLMCKHDPQCIWFTYFASSKMCIQYTTCEAIDETCTECISGEFSCVAEGSVPKGFTKLVIANGKNSNTYLDTIEVIDLSPESQVCNDLPIFPYKGCYQMGGVHNQTTPLICGGTDGSNVVRSECYSLKNNVWTQIQSMTVPRSTAATTLFPSEAATSSQDYLVIGGDNSATGYLTSVEAYTSTGWQPMGSSMPEGIFESCSVTLNSTTVMLIGGHTDSQPVSSTTYLYDSVTKIWHTSASLMIARKDLSCGIIRTEDNGDYIIVAGGIDSKNNYQTKTEILEPGFEVWKEGPSLPKALASGIIVEDIRTRSIIYVGGYVQSVGTSVELYRLSAPLTITSQWELMPQKLKTPRHWMTAFLVPDHFVNCNEVKNEIATVQ